MLHFACVQVGGSLFHDKDIEEMWRLLRIAVMFYLRPYDEDFDEEPDYEDEGSEDLGEDGAIDGAEYMVGGGVGAGDVARDRTVRRAYLAGSRHARRCLFKYAVLAEKFFGHRLCKSNLHACLCSLPVQQATRGHAFYFTEFWLEQLVQWAKHTTKFRTTGCPEKLIMGCILMKLALDRCVVRSSSFLDMSGWIDKVKGVARADTFAGTHLDHTDGVVGFLGSGEVASGDALVMCRNALTHFIADFPAALVGWSEEDMEEAQMLLYKRAQLGGGEIVHSSAYDRAISRVSCFVYIQYEEHVGHRIVDAHYVGHVRCFLKVSSKSGVGEVRFAVTDLYKADRVVGPAGVLLYAHGMCGSTPRPHQKRYPVVLSAMCGKVVRCLSGALTALLGDSKVAFVPYSHVPSAVE